MLKILTWPEVYLDNCEVSIEVWCFVLRTQFKKYHDDSMLSERNLKQKNIVLVQFILKADTNTKLNIQKFY